MVTRGELEIGENYCSGIRFTSEERLDLGLCDVIWGRPHIEGILLGKIFNVNLRVVSIEQTEENNISIEYLRNPNNYLPSDNYYRLILEKEQF
jgi:hypothetical protein